MNGDELPRGWRWVRLAEVAEINPRRPAINRPDDAPTSFVPMEAVDEVAGVASPRLRPYREVKKGYTYFEAGDVLFAKITPCMENGKQAIADNLAEGFGFGTTEFHVVRSGPEVTATWLHRFLRQPRIRAAAANAFTGAVGQQRVPPAFLSELALPFPPLPEQRRIADAIDAAMAEAEAAARVAEAQQVGLERLRICVLNAAFDDAATGASEKTLGDVSPCIDYGVTASADANASGPRFLRITDIQDRMSAVTR